MSDRLLTLDEAANLMEIDRETVRKWLDRGLPAEQGEDGAPRISRRELDAFLLREGQGVSRDASTEV